MFGFSLNSYKYRKKMFQFFLKQNNCNHDLRDTLRYTKQNTQIMLSSQAGTLRCDISELMIKPRTGNVLNHTGDRSGQYVINTIVRCIITIL